jgi:signal transduction histidine kinase
MSFSGKFLTTFIGFSILMLFLVSVISGYYVNLFPLYILTIIATSHCSKHTFKTVFYLCLLSILVTSYLAIPQLSGVELGDVLIPMMTLFSSVAAYLLLRSRNAKQYTDTQLLIDKLRDSQDIQKLQSLSGSVAHDFNNIMSVVMGNAELLKYTLSQPESSKQFIDAILEAVQKGIDLTQNLLSFAQKQFLQPTDIDLNQLISKHLSDIDLPLDAKNTIHFTATPDLWTAKVDPRFFRECLLHLIQNAIQANSNHIEIKVTNVFDKSSVEATLVDPKRYVSMVISDDGLGITDQNLRRIYQPFFTTRKAQGAKGLGLSAVWGFCQQSGGSIDANSTLGKGTMFKIIIPATLSEK